MADILADDAKKLRKGKNDRTDAIVQALKVMGESCVICDRLTETMRRYAYTTIYLFEHEAEFKSYLENSKGFCLKHFALLAESSGEFSAKTRSAFLSALYGVQKQNMKRVAVELEWFTQKFNHMNKDKPWGNSKDAPRRAINKLKGRVLVNEEE